jgi:SAM-dependent methyltransferase
MIILYMYFYREQKYLQLIIMLAIGLMCLWYYRRVETKTTIENFSQLKPYVLREENEVYDSFYIDKYDDYFQTESYSEDDLLTIIDKTQPLLRTSVILDIGCGTGGLMKALENKKYKVFGVDKSVAMIEKAKEKLTDGEVICDNVLRDPMLYENNTFSHISCTHFTIYEVEDKNTFFRHCFHWLKGGGYFILHVINPEKFNKIVPKSDLFTHVKQPIIKTTTIKFDEYDYTNTYENLDNHKTTQVEQFTSKNFSRQHRKTLYMTPKNELLSLVLKCGFVIHSESVYANFIKDDDQSLVVFVKPHCGDN